MYSWRSVRDGERRDKITWAQSRRLRKKEWFIERHVYINKGGGRRVEESRNGIKMEWKATDKKRNKIEKQENKVGKWMKEWEKKCNGEMAGKKVECSKMGERSEEVEGMIGEGEEKNKKESLRRLDWTSTK